MPAVDVSNHPKLRYNGDMKAEIISIGTEILLGEIIDTNASFIAAELPRFGIDIYWISQVGDNRERLSEVLTRAWNRSDLIFTTGGLGPTEGDITRSTIAHVAGEELTLDPGYIESLRARAVRSGRAVSPSNLKQAGIIPSATFIPNTRGTAPGWWLQKGDKILIAMPGPPAEMRAMWQNGVLPRISELKTGRVIVSHTIKMWGIPESSLNDMFLPLYASANPTLATYVKDDGNYIRIAAKAENEEKTRELIAPIKDKLLADLGDAVWGTDNDTLEAVAIRLLTEKKASLAIIEGYSGGQLINIMSEATTASSFFKGGIVAGSDEALRATGISGSLYENSGLLADAIRRKFNADIGISITDFPTENKIPGETSGTIYVGIAYKDTTKSVPIVSVRERARAKRWVVSAALFELIKTLRAG